MYAGDTQMQDHATINQDNQYGKIDEVDGEARIRKEILPERHAQSTIEQDPTAHARI